MTDFETILLDRKGRVGLITLNRPKALNALNSQLMREVVAAVEELDADREIGAIVITGSEKAFAAGADIKEMAPKTYSEAYGEDFFSDWDKISSARTPIIAAVSGYALGGGCELVMHADIIVAGESAQFGQPEINLGIIPGAGGTQRLTRAVGKSLAMKMVLAGEFIPAREALAAGLVAEVTADDACIGRAHELARKIAGKAPLAVRLAKDAVLQAFETPLAAGMVLERRNFVVLAGTDDRNEGVNAFLEKRKPVWKGR